MKNIQIGKNKISFELAKSKGEEIGTFRSLEKDLCYTEGVAKILSSSENESLFMKTIAVICITLSKKAERYPLCFCQKVMINDTSEITCIDYDKQKIMLITSEEYHKLMDGKGSTKDMFWFSAIRINEGNTHDP